MPFKNGPEILYGSEAAGRALSDFRSRDKTAFPAYSKAGTRTQGEASREYVRLNKLIFDVRKFAEFSLPLIYSRELRAFASGYLLEMLNSLNITEKSFSDPADKRFVAETYALLKTDLIRLKDEHIKIRQLLSKCVTSSFIKSERKKYLANYTFYSTVIESGKSALFSFQIYAFLAFAATYVFDTDGIMLFNGLTLFGLLLLLWLAGFFFFAARIIDMIRYSKLLRDMMNKELCRVTGIARSTGLIRNKINTQLVIEVLENYLQVLGRDIRRESQPFVQFPALYASLTQVFGV